MSEKFSVHNYTVEQILNFIKSNEILSFKERFVSSINNFFLIEDEKSALIELMTERFKRVGGDKIENEYHSSLSSSGSL